VAPGTAGRTATPLAAWLSRITRVSRRRSVRLGALALALLFLIAVLRSHWQGLSAYRFTIRAWPLVLSLLLLATAWLLEVVLWRFVLSRLGYRLPLVRASGVWFLSNIVRYIPGNVWQFLGMMELAADSGVPRAVTMTSVALHQVLSNLAGLLVGAYVIVAGGRLTAYRYVALAALLMLALAIVAPRLLPRLLGWLVHLGGGQPAPVRLTPWANLALLVFYAVYWLLAGLAFWQLGMALNLPLGGLPGLCVSAFALAYVSGYLSLLTPSGLGVREGVLVLLLSAALPGSGVALLAIAARVWMVSGELLATAASAALNRSLLRIGSG